MPTENELIEIEDDVESEIDTEGLPQEYVPDGWESAEEFLADVVKKFEEDVQYDKDNRDWALEDLQFTAGDQWDPQVKAAREAAQRPCLTINVLPQFVGQVIGDRRMNKTSIKVRPLKDGTMQVADVRSGLIKSIEAYSRAERAYDAACEDQVTCGISALRVDLEYAGNDVFEQDLFIRHVPNPLSVVWDKMSVDPTGRDARHCFVLDKVPTTVYNKRFPNHPAPTGFSDDATRRTDGWWDSESVRLVEYWELVDKPATFALMADGDVKDVTGLDREEYDELLWRHPNTGQVRIRESFRTYARMHLVTEFAILDGPYEIPLTRLPIVRVEGRVVRVGDDRVRFGLVRFAKDSQRLKNYWRSVAAELLALAPRAQWMMPSDAVEGRERDWENPNAAQKLVYNKNASQKPERVEPPAVQAAILQEAQLNQQDIKDTTGLHDASLGMRSNEVSGKAIDARKSQGDIATVIYHDNLNHAIQEVGDICNQLIPIAYDTVRTARIIGDDDKHKLVTLNDPTDEDSPDITKGKYDVVLETGPSFSTQRREALDAMMALLQTNPDVFQVIGDLVAKNMDWPGAFEIAERLRKLPSIQQFLEGEEEGEGGQLSQEQLQQTAAMEQEQAAAAAAQEAQQEAMAIELAKEREAARKAAAEADTAEHQAREAEAKARTAEAKAIQAEFESRTAPARASQQMRLAERSASAKDQSAKPPRSKKSTQAPRKDNR